MGAGPRERRHAFLNGSCWDIDLYCGHIRSPFAAMGGSRPTLPTSSGAARGAQSGSAQRGLPAKSGSGWKLLAKPAHLRRRAAYRCGAARSSPAAYMAELMGRRGSAESQRPRRRSDRSGATTSDADALASLDIGSAELSDVDAGSPVSIVRGAQSVSGSSTPRDDDAPGDEIRGAGSWENPARRGIRYRMRKGLQGTIGAIKGIGSRMSPRRTPETESPRASPRLAGMQRSPLPGTRTESPIPGRTDSAQSSPSVGQEDLGEDERMLLCKLRFVDERDRRSNRRSRRSPCPPPADTSPRGNSSPPKAAGAARRSRSVEDDPVRSPRRPRSLDRIPEPLHPRVHRLRKDGSYSPASDGDQAAGAGSPPDAPARRMSWPMPRPFDPHAFPARSILCRPGEEEGMDAAARRRRRRRRTLQVLRFADDDGMALETVHCFDTGANAATGGAGASED